MYALRRAFPVFFLVLLFIASAELCAQEFRGSLLGSVKDASGALIPGATVTAINVETNVSTSTVTSDIGRYRIPFLLPGNYSVIVELPGFRRLERTGIRISAGTDLDLDCVLEVGEVSNSVTVSGSTAAVSSTNADLALVVEQKYVQNIPVSLTRNVLNKVLLTPGVTVASSGGTVTSNGQTDITINGGGGNQSRNEITIDGIPNTVPRSGGVAVYIPSQDSVEEMKVQTTLFDAAYGHSNAGAISITTRAGTNQWHGSLYDFKRWRALNANSWRNNYLGLERPPVSYNQVGGMFGGPVILPGLYNGRDRTFFMFSFEKTKDASPRTREARVPTELERAGDFSQTLNRKGTAILEIYDPWTTQGTGSKATRTLFANSRIPQNRLDRTGLAVMKAYPLPNVAATTQIGVNNWAGAGVYQVLEDSYSIRVDHALSSRQRMFARYSKLTRADEFVPVLFPGVLSFTGPGQSDLGVSYRYFHSLAVDDTITFSPSFVGSFRYGLSTRDLPKLLGVAEGSKLADPAVLDLPQIILDNQATRGFPIFNMGENIPQIGARNDVENWYTHTGLATFYKMIGKHSLKFGADYRLTRWNKIYLGDGQSGSFTYSSVFTQKNPFVNSSADTSGSGMASLLLGVPASGSLGYNSSLANQNHYLALFVQEDWKALPHLTLNFGLRYELETPYTERFNRTAHGFDFSAPSPLDVPGLELKGGLLFAGVGGNPRREGNVDANNFGPRFGFAYSVNSKTVVRGGYGLFFSAQGYNTGFDGAVATFNAVTTYTGTIDSGATPFTTIQNPFPGGLRGPEGNSKGLAARYGDSLTIMDQNRVNPYNQQWQISLQRELPGAFVAEGAYVGMLSLKRLESFNLNEKPDEYLVLGADETKKMPNPFLGIFDPLSSLGKGSTISQGQLWKNYPQYSSLTMEGANTGRAIFHGFQGRLQGRFNQGLSSLLSYTFSKSIVNNTTSWVNTRNYRSVSSLDRRHVLRMALLYELPFGPGKPLASSGGLLGRIVEGWSMSGFLEAMSGAALSVSHTNGRPITLRNPTKEGPIAERLGDRVDPATGKVLNPFFDTDAFQALPNQYTISSTETRLDWLRGPGAVCFNLAILKDVTIRENIRLQIRGEADNLTNARIWGAPGTNMSSPKTFGVIQDGGSGRSIQIGAALRF
ncbi:MAG: carboxypeptidase regulatory-like domain-containing protein [Acidobacteriota bacterium]